MIEFKDVSLENKEEIISFLDKVSSYSSEFSFANIFAWQGTYKVKYAIYKDAFTLVYKLANGDVFVFYPLSDKNAEGIFKEIIEKLMEQGIKPKIRLWNEEQASVVKRMYGDKVKLYEDKNIEEYVYEREKLVKLTGKKLHSKRNHINKFKSLYNWKYKKMDKKLAIECIDVFNVWMDEKDKKLEGVTEATLKFLNNFDELELTGGCLMADDKIVAFSVGEQISEEVAAVHLEYGDKNYEGVFQTINREFVANEWQDVKYINREEDMGIEGLRKAKKSYIPDMMVKKYIAEINF